MTINVTDVLEPPPKPSAPSVSRNSTNPQTKLDVSWTAPNVTGKPPITDYDVQYKKSSDSTWTPHTFTGTSTTTTLINLTANTTYQVQVKAKNAEGNSGWSASGEGSTAAATNTPSITVARHSTMPTPPSGYLSEGGEVRFVLTASKAPKANLTVNITISEPVPGFLPAANTLPTSVTIPKNKTTADVTVRTVSDKVNEPNGSVWIYIQSGNGYSIGTPSSTFVLMDDDDGPPVPSNLQGNGWTGNSKSSIWWRQVAEATSYELNYAVEKCPVRGFLGIPSEQLRACITEDWQSLAVDTSAGPSGASTNPPSSKWANILLSRLSPAESTLYRLRVRAVDADGDQSGWSDPAFVFAAAGIPQLPDFVPEDFRLPWPQVATSPILGFNGQAETSNSPYKVKYVICNAGEIQGDFGVTVGNITSSMNTWMHLAHERPDTSIFSFERNATERQDDCGSVTYIQPAELDYNEVRFVKDRKFQLAKCGAGHSSCYRSYSIWLKHHAPASYREFTTLDLLTAGRIMLREKERYGQAWSTRLTDGATTCTLAQHAVAHETGHLLGIGMNVDEGHENLGFPNLSRDSLMSNPWPDTTLHCRPQPYDVVAVMSYHQYRPPMSTSR